MVDMSCTGGCYRRLLYCFAWSWSCFRMPADFIFWRSLSWIWNLLMFCGTSTSSDSCCDMGLELVFDLSSPKCMKSLFCCAMQLLWVGLVCTFVSGALVTTTNGFTSSSPTSSLFPIERPCFAGNTISKKSDILVSLRFEQQIC